MAEVTVSSLDLRLQKQVESAQSALNRGQADVALELCAAVLDAQPACLAVRRLERAARLRQGVVRASALARLVTTLSSTPMLISGSRQLHEKPQEALATAERLLRRNPRNVPALGLLGQAATALGWTETAVFAHEAACDLAPERLDLWLPLGGAYLPAGRAQDAVLAAEEALRLHPADADAQNLMRNATVNLTVAQGNWDKGGDYRGKMKQSPHSIDGTRTGN